MYRKTFFINIVIIAFLITSTIIRPAQASPVKSQNALATGTSRTDALVLVNSNSANYSDFQHFIQPYLDNFGVPYTTLDIATTPVTASIGDYAVIIVGHRQLDVGGADLNGTEQGIITSAVNSGTGLVNFDNALSANGSTPNYQYVNTIFGFGYTTSPTFSGVTFPTPQSNYITQLHSTGETITTGNMTLAGITLPNGVTGLALSGTKPFLAVTTYGQGHAVQWGTYDWMSNAVKGPLFGLDDLVWRSIVWAARKPFTMQGMPPFVTMRMDDVSNPTLWAHTANDFGFIPWLGLFPDDLSEADAADVSNMVNSGKATASIHAFNTSDLFYFDHYNGTNFSDAKMAANYTQATQWFSSHNIPLSKVVVPHFYEIGSNAFGGLKNWGVEFVGTQMDPGQLADTADWMMKGPYRLYETGAADDMTRNPYYADFMSVPGHPEMDGQFFNCMSEIRDVTGYEWLGNDRTGVTQATQDGTAWLKRGFDSMALATLFSHEYLFANSMPQADWRAILQGITQNISSYQPIYVSLDYGCQYVRAMKTSNIASGTYDLAGNQVTVNLTGKTDLTTKFYVFSETAGTISQTPVDVPVFSGSTQVVYASPSSLNHIVVSPSQSDTTPGGTLQFTAQGYDVNNNLIRGLSFTWAVVNGGGTTNANGLFTAGQIPGVYTNTISASVGTIHGYASVTVNGPNGGPGGPILLIANSSDPFSLYYAEILRAEGLNYFTITDISQVNLTMLGNYKIAILGATSLTSTQVQTLTNWVQVGGKLIAMRPDKQLSGLLGLTDNSATLQDAYLKVDTTQAPGLGIVADSIQYHSTADFYTINGATTVATLYSNAITPTTHPAVTLRKVGTSGGQAAAFTYDLARSIVYTRQGNPAWSGQERDGYTPIRSDDLFYPSYVDLDKVAIPQADEQQRLLANMIGYMDYDSMPMPRFWYFPQNMKAVVVLTGDDHGNNGTAENFDDMIAASPAGCSVADWQCIRATSYIYTATPLTNQQAFAYQNMGFEIGVHVNSDCLDWTPTTLDSLYTTQINSWKAKYTSLTSPVTHRIHCIVWSDWATQPKVELSHGIRFDTNYYYWPDSWITNRPGMFTGSGMPMRFADLNGTMIDVYQATTQITDESGLDIALNINTLLDNALSNKGYYGAFTMNIHNDGSNSDMMTIVDAAKQRSVPVVSAQQMLTWLDGRNKSSFGSLAWNGNAESFTINVGTGARGLTAMLPVNSGAGWLSAITLNGSSVGFTTQTIKGISYALFPANAGTYTASYFPDANSPTVTTTVPTSGAGSINVNSTVKAIFSEGMTASSVSTSSFVLQDANNVQVPATVTYDPNTWTATLTPLQSLSAPMVFTAVVKGGANGVKDLSGNPMIADYTWSFSTVQMRTCPCSIWGSTGTPDLLDVNAGTPIEVGFKFQAKVDGYITGLRFYKGDQNTGTHVGHLWTATGTKLAEAIFTNETASGWQEVTLAVPVPISDGTTYIASYYSPNGEFSDTAEGFGTAIDNPPVKALANGEDGVTGIYNYGSSGFPTQHFDGHSPNYWVDVLFDYQATGDTTIPSVTATLPAAGATGVGMNTPVTVTFSEAMSTSTVNSATFVLQDANNVQVPATVTYDPNIWKATLTPSQPLSAPVVYTVVVKGGAGGVRDLAGNAMVSDFTWSFTTSLMRDCPCSIWGSTGIPQLLNVNTDGPIEVGFKFRAQVDGFITGLRFFKGDQNTGIHVGHLWTATGTQLAEVTFTNETASGWQEVNLAVPVAITGGTTYVASYYSPNGEISDTVEGFATAIDNPPVKALANGEDGDNGVYNNGASGFPTQHYNGHSPNYWMDILFNYTATADSTPPTVAITQPAAGATGIGISTLVKATFNEAITTSTINATSFFLRDANEVQVPATVAYDPTTLMVTLTPSQSLSAAMVYTAVVKGGASGVKDLAGNAMTSDFTWSFNTIQFRPCPCSVWGSAGTPDLLNVNAGTPIEVGFKFRAQVDGYITGLRFYKGDQNSGTHVGHLWTTTGTKLAEVIFTNETASGWQEVNLVSPVAITIGTTYIASYYSPNGEFSDTPEGFATAIDNSPVKALANGEDGVNGVYNYGAIGFPTQHYDGHSPNYWMDVIFDYTAATDTTPPGVAATQPASGATSTATNTTVTAIFTEAVDAATITPTTFTLQDPNGLIVLTTLTYDPATLTAKLVLIDPLAGLTSYKATLKGGANGIKDLAGNAMTSDFTWTFSTVQLACPCSIWGDTGTPDLPNVNVGTPIEVGFKFRAQDDGYITGLRFYKGDLNTGTHIGHLWSSDGTQLAEATFTNETASGWQEVILSTQVRIAANATYIASYYSPNGDISDTVESFATAIETPPLRALANGEDGVNGVYNYGATGFPNQHYNGHSPNYWVDVIFMPLPDYTLTSTVIGSGTITKSPEKNTYHPDDIVQFTANPARGWSFDSWSGDLISTANPATVTVKSSATVTATFTINNYPLSVTKAGNGSGTITSSPGGIDCGSTCTADYVFGSMVTLSAAPAIGSYFTGWSGACTGTGDCTVTIDLVNSVTATFTLLRYPLSVAKAGNGTGTISSSPTGISCGATCSSDYNYGTQVTLTAAPGTGSTFTGWDGACTGTGSCTVTIDGAKSVTAAFTLIRYTLSVANAGNGSGTLTSSPAGISCGTTCSSDYDYGTLVTLTPAPATGSTFTGWSGSCTGTGTCTVTINAAKSVTATFTLLRYTLSVAKNGNGSGTVTSSPSGISCGYTCSASYNYGTLVTLTPSASGGSAFNGWSGACTGNGACTVTIDAAKSVTATFTLTRTLTVTKAGNGSSSGTVTSAPAGIACGSTCSASFIDGTSVTLTAAPGTGSTFTGWSGSCSGTGTCTVTMSAARSVTATFTLLRYTLSVAKNGTGSGTVTSSPSGISCGYTCSASYNYGTLVTLTPSASGGSAFNGWSGACTGNGACTVTIDAAKSVTATFTLTRTLTVTKAGNGSSSGTVTSAPAGIACGSTCSASFIDGTSVTLTAAPGTGSTFTGWSGSCSGTGTCTVTMSAARSVTATFTLNIYALTVAKTGSGSGTVTSSPSGISCGATCSANYNYGTLVTLTPSPDAGSAFNGWSGACTGTGACTVTVDAAKSVTTTFTLTRTLTVTKAGNGSGTVTSNPAGISCGSSCSASFNDGTSVTLTPAASTGSSFTGWGGSCSGTGTCTVTMSAARTVTATFTLNTYALTVTKTGSGSGTVTSAPVGITCGSTCSAVFNYNTLVTLTATPTGSYRFYGWSGACSGTGTCTVTMSVARNVSANFR